MPGSAHDSLPGDFLGTEFFNVPEMRPVEMLLRRAVCGLQFSVSARRELTPLFERILSCSGPERIVAVISILAQLARARGTRSICTSGFSPFLDRTDQQRLERV